MTDDGLKQLQGLDNLERLWLNDTLVTDDGLANLNHCKSLRLLGIGGGTRVTKDGLAQIREALPNCELH